MHINAEGRDAIRCDTVCLSSTLSTGKLLVELTNRLEVNTVTDEATNLIAIFRSICVLNIEKCTFLIF